MYLSLLKHPWSDYFEGKKIELTNPPNSINTNPTSTCREIQSSTGRQQAMIGQSLFGRQIQRRVHRPRGICSEWATAQHTVRTPALECMTLTKETNLRKKPRENPNNWLLVWRGAETSLHLQWLCAEQQGAQEQIKQVRLWMLMSITTCTASAQRARFYFRVPRFFWGWERWMGNRFFFFSIMEHISESGTCPHRGEICSQSQVGDSAKQINKRWGGKVTLTLFAHIIFVGEMAESILTLGWEVSSSFSYWENEKPPCRLQLVYQTPVARRSYKGFLPLSLQPGSDFSKDWELYQSPLCGEWNHLSGNAAACVCKRGRTTAVYLQVSGQVKLWLWSFAVRGCCVTLPPTLI